jgi:hypothetical protein
MGVGVLADAVLEYIVGPLTLLWRHYMCDKFIIRRNYGAGKHLLIVILAACPVYFIEALHPPVTLSLRSKSSIASFVAFTELLHTQSDGGTL